MAINVPVFLTAPFWFWWAVAVAIAWAGRRSSNLAISAGLLFAAQIMILWRGLNIPLVVLATSTAVWSLLYGLTVKPRSNAIRTALVTGVVVVLFLRRRLFLGSATPDAVGGVDRFYFLVGFSYVVLRFISFSTDLRSGKIPQPRWSVFLCYLFLAPAFVAGPIDRYPRFAGNLENRSPLTWEASTEALLRILSGLVKKLFVVKILMPHSLAAVRSVEALALPVPALWLRVFVYSLVIYLDFSGYTDLAIGSARFFGMSLPENFRWPYLQKNIIDFWNRWHMTLSNWLRDYLFLPLGQRFFRVRSLAASPLLIGTLAYCITMTFCGVWHEPTWGFAVWGLLHGLALAVCKITRTKVMRLKSETFRRAWMESRLSNALSTLVTFAFVSVTWVFFLFDGRTAARILCRLGGVNCG